jgi:VWFA-related protein
MRRIVAAAAALLLVSSGPRAQAPQPQDPAQPPTFRTGVGAVRVDVTVLDGGGRPVADLAKDDFEILEDGEPQQIQFVEHVRLTGEPPPGSDASLAIRSPDHARQEAAREDVRLMVIFIDDYHLTYGILENTRLRRGLIRFVEESLKPLDLFAVMGPLTTLSDLELTRDRAELTERINRLEGRLGGFVPPRSAVEEAHMRFGAGNLGRIRAQVTYSALHALVTHLGGLREGRKSVLFVSQGPPTRAAGQELFSELQAILAAANRSNVVIHTLDPRQLGGALRIGAVNEALAADTGGRRIGLTNDFSKALGDVMSDASQYYLLGYESKRPTTDGKFHRIAVKVRRKGVRVIARNGYWAPKPEEIYSAAAAAATAAAVPAEISTALDQLQDLSRRTVLLDWVGFDGPTATGRGVTVVYEALRASGGARPASVDIEVKAPGGVKSSPAPEQAGDGLWIARLDLPAGRTSVRTTARDEKGETLETWVREIDVDADDPLPTPVLYRISSPAQARALRMGSSMPPSAMRRFRRGERAVVRWAVADDAEVRAEILNRQGNLVSALAVTRSVPGIAQVELPVAGLAHADYLLRLSRRGSSSATATLAFAIVP